MKQQIKITVEVPDHVHAGQFKTVFSIVKVVDDSVDFDFKSVLLGLSVLYRDQDGIIHFSVI